MLAAAVAVSCGRTAAPAPPSEHLAATPFDRVVQDVCEKRIVLLGEDNHHDGGATLALKSTLVSRLIDECGFSAVIFEASLAEFVDLDRALAAGTASPDHIADAIGGLWSVARESDPLVTALYDRATRKHVVLAGLDGQLGSTNLFVKTGLAGELASYLADGRRSACEAELQRYVNWQYDAATPLDDTRRAQLRDCLADIERAAARPPRARPGDEAAAMASALHDGVAISDPALSKSSVFNLRDQAMYRALQWHIARLPPNSKIIVWCATIHAAKTLRDMPDLAEYVSIGSFIHRDFGDRAAAIGITALAGSYGRGKSPATELPLAPPSSLEARALSVEPSSSVAYLGPADLLRSGRITARAIDYTQLADAPWHTVVDGLLVLRQERPYTYAHAPLPRRAPPSAR